MRMPMSMNALLVTMPDIAQTGGVVVRCASESLWQCYLSAAARLVERACRTAVVASPSESSSITWAD